MSHKTAEKLSKIRGLRSKYMDGSTGFLEIPKRVEDLCKNLELDILPKNH